MENSEEMDPAYFDHLPNEILVNVFSYLLIEEVCSLSVVERRLAKLIAESMNKYWTTFILRRIRGTDFHQIMPTIHSVEKIKTNYSKFGSFIEDVLSNMDTSDEDNLLSKVTESKLWRNLEIEHIDGNNATELNGSALKLTITGDLLINRFLFRWIFINLNVDNIKKLYIRWEHINDGEMEYVLNKCTNLEELGICESSKPSKFVTDKVIPILAAKCPRLKSFGAFFSISNAGIDKLTRRCTDLVQLKFRASKKITDKSLASISSRCKSLKSIELTHEAQAISSSAFQNFIQALPNLENLKVATLANVKNEVFATIAQHCTGFQSLSIVSLEKGTKSKTYTDDFFKKIQNMRLKRLNIVNVRLLRDDSPFAAAFCHTLAIANNIVEELRLWCVDVKVHISIGQLFVIVQNAPNLSKISVSELVQDLEERFWAPNERSIVKLFNLLGDKHLRLLKDLSLHFSATPDSGLTFSSTSIKSLKLSSSTFSIGGIPSPKFDMNILAPNLTDCSLLLNCTDNLFKSLADNSKLIETMSMSSHQLLTDPIKNVLSSSFPNLKIFSGEAATTIVSEHHTEALIRSQHFSTDLSWKVTDLKIFKPITSIIFNPSKDPLENFLPVLKFGSVVLLSIFGNVSNVISLSTSDMLNISKNMKHLRKLRLRYIDIHKLHLDSASLQFLRLEYINSLQYFELDSPNLIEISTDRVGDVTLPLKIIQQLKQSNCPMLNSLRLHGSTKETDTQEIAEDHNRNFICDLDSIHTLALVSDARIQSFSARMSNLVTLNLHNIRHLRQVSITACHSLTCMTISFCKNLETFSCDANNLRTMAFGFNGFLSTVKIRAPKLHKLSLEYCGDYLLQLLQSVLNSCGKVSKIIVKKESFSPFISPNDENPIFEAIGALAPNLETITIFGQWFTPNSFNNLIERLGNIQLVKTKPKLPGESLNFLRLKNVTYFEKL